MDEIAAFTGLGPFLAMPVKTYSAGMQGRLAARSGHGRRGRDPAHGRMDRRGRRRFRSNWRTSGSSSSSERAGILVLASHDTDLLRLYCNKVMRMEGGVASPVTPIRKLDELMAQAPAALRLQANP